MKKIFREIVILLTMVLIVILSHSLLENKIPPEYWVWKVGENLPETDCTLVKIETYEIVWGESSGKETLPRYFIVHCEGISGFSCLICNRKYNSWGDNYHVFYREPLLILKRPLFKLCPILTLCIPKTQATYKVLEIDIINMNIKIKRLSP